MTMIIEGFNLPEGHHCVFILGMHCSPHLQCLFTVPILFYNLQKKLSLLSRLPHLLSSSSFFFLFFSSTKPTMAVSSSSKPTMAVSSSSSPRPQWPPLCNTHQKIPKLRNPEHNHTRPRLKLSISWPRAFSETNQ
jgi:hypothetical protein